MTTCQHCHQPLPEPKKALECYVTHYPQKCESDKYISVFAKQDRALQAVAVNGEVIHMREVLPIPKEERKPRQFKYWIISDEQAQVIELTPSVRAALINAGVILE